MNRIACTVAVLLLTSRVALAQEHDHDQHATHGDAHAEHAGHTDHQRDEHAGHTTHEHPSATSKHVPPDPPQHVMPAMTHKEMDTLMEMSDSRVMWSNSLDELELRSGDDDSVLSWDAHAWYGGDVNKLVIESEGERSDDHGSASRLDVMWDRAWTRWWNLRAGVRHDFAEVDRNWAAIGVAGLAPYYLEVEAMVYVSDEGQSALRLDVSRELLVTQRLVLEPAFELAAFAEDDVRAGHAQGLSQAEFGLRLRYEIEREFAPYVGVSYERVFGAAADAVEADDGDASEWKYMAGVRVWF